MEEEVRRQRPDRAPPTDDVSIDRTRELFLDRARTIGVLYDTLQSVAQ